jgi:hypothetical protein
MAYPSGLCPTSMRRNPDAAVLADIGLHSNR